MNRRHRLSNSEEFWHVRRQGRSWSHPLLVLLAVRNDLNCTRFGFLVSKRIGKAVVRNRVRRLLREAVRARLVRIAVGWDIVLIARAPIVQASLWDIGEALDSLLQRAELSAELNAATDPDICFRSGGIGTRSSFRPTASASSCARRTACRGRLVPAGRVSRPERGGTARGLGGADT